MAQYADPAKKAKMEIRKIDVNDGLGNPSSRYEVSASSYGYAFKKDDIWIYDADMRRFNDSVENLVDGQTSQIQLEAMSEFTCKVDTIAANGYFKVELYAFASLNGNACRLNIEMDAQALVDFVSSLSRL